MYKAILTSLALVFSGAALAGSDFQSLDQDQDGYISPTEAASDSKLSTMWSEADANGDGQVDQAEFSALEISQDKGGDASGSQPASE